MPVPTPTSIFRFIHVDNLHIYVQRGGLHAPNHTPDNGLLYKTIHNISIQQNRRVTPIPCGPGDVIHDYVSFYFGYLSPMMLQLKTGQVQGYDEGQEPLIYLVSSAQAIASSDADFVLSDGHGIAAFTSWYDDLTYLNQVDWDMVYRRYWHDNVEDMDRQRQKQAEFLVHRFCDWTLIQEIGVMNEQMKIKVEDILNRLSDGHSPRVRVRREWYYY